MSVLRQDNYAIIQGWMLTDLKLKGNELLIYAVIYGFSQAENQVYNGSLRYLAEWTNSTKQGVMKNLKSLVEKGYIQKREMLVNGVKFCEYYATKLNGAVNNVVQGGKQSLPGGMQQSLPNNKELNKKEYTKEEKSAKRFTPPTLEEVKAYCQERNNRVDPEQFVDFYASKGWKVGAQPMKDWKAAVRTWEKRDAERVKPKPKDDRWYKSNEENDDSDWLAVLGKGDENGL